MPFFPDSLSYLKKLSSEYQSDACGNVFGHSSISEKIAILGQLPGGSLPDQREQGNMAVFMAISMTVLLSMMALVLDTGYLISEHNRFQNAAESAALAGAVRLCDDDVFQVAREVAREHAAPYDLRSLTIEKGFYDEKEVYTDFGRYTDFVSETDDDFPEEEYNNAVLVRITSTDTGLTGLNEGKGVAVEAVAYLKRYGIVSPMKDGEIRLGHDTTFRNGDIYCNGDIKYPEYVMGTFEHHYPPVFENVNLLATGFVKEVRSQANFLGDVSIEWAQGRRSPLSNAFQGIPEHRIRPLNEEYFEYLKAKSDIVYQPDQAGRDSVFYGSVIRPEGSHFYFDLAGHTDRTRYYFETDNPNGDTVDICQRGPNSHNSRGDRVENVTFVTNCKIRIIHSSTWPGYPTTIYLGGADDAQLIVMSSDSINLEGSGFSLTGAAFRTGKDFIFPKTSSFSGDHNFRVVAYGDIEIESYHASFEFHFGPPCPPSIPKLGRLIAKKR